jgi:hypothetical protein
VSSFAEGEREGRLDCKIVGGRGILDTKAERKRQREGHWTPMWSEREGRHCDKIYQIYYVRFHGDGKRKKLCEKYISLALAIFCYVPVHVHW